MTVVMPNVRQPETRDSDWKLLSLTAEGDEDAFRELVERHQDRLVGLCYRLLGEREEALDAAQEVFLKTYSQAGSLEPRGELFTWMYRVATNFCLNRIRRRKLARFLSLTTDSPEETASLEPVDEAPDAFAKLEARRRWRQTVERIATLPESQRLVLILARFEGLPYRQIGEILGISRGAVESRLFRAMRHLQRAQDSAAPGVSSKG
jgi:RNA polymerase sigma-70 factor (ECF subfamily)